MTSAATGTRAWAAARGYPLTYFERVGSTNDEAKRADEGERVYLAAHQTAGRGRGDNSWIDEGGGQTLLASWARPVTIPPRAITAPRVGLALHAALTRAFPGLLPGLKAPNDIYLGDRKLAGLLIEVISQGDRARLIVGLGLNVFKHPGRLGTATDLTLARGAPPTEGEWFVFLDEWRRELDRATIDCARDELTPDVRLELRRALNAHAARRFEVAEVSPHGDLIHAGGVVRWTDL